MAYDENLAQKIRERLSDLADIEEKEMFGGIVFMLHDKMCVGVLKDHLLCRIDPALYDDALEQNGCHPMDASGKSMRGWLLIEESGISRAADFEHWIRLALDFNERAKKSVRRKK